MFKVLYFNGSKFDLSYLVFMFLMKSYFHVSSSTLNSLSLRLTRKPWFASFSVFSSPSLYISLIIFDNESFRAHNAFYENDFIQFITLLNEKKDSIFEYSIEIKRLGFHFDPQSLEEPETFGEKFENAVGVHCEHDEQNLSLFGHLIFIYFNS